MDEIPFLGLSGTDVIFKKQKKQKKKTKRGTPIPKGKIFILEVIQAVQPETDHLNHEKS
jgi:hypothetical protein